MTQRGLALALEEQEYDDDNDDRLQTVHAAQITNRTVSEAHS